MHRIKISIFQNLYHNCGHKMQYAAIAIKLRCKWQVGALIELTDLNWNRNSVGYHLQMLTFSRLVGNFVFWWPTLMTYFVDLFCVFGRILIIIGGHVIRECETHTTDESCKIRLRTVLFKYWIVVELLAFQLLSSSPSLGSNNMSMSILQHRMSMAKAVNERIRMGKKLMRYNKVCLFYNAQKTC